MTGKWNLGRLATIGGLAMTTGLLIGLGPAHADELADLRANQQLLQQRIDQLAQMQAQAPPPPGVQGGGATQGLGYKAAPGIPVGGGSFPRSFLIPGTDTSIRVGGFVDFTTLYFINGGGNVNGSNYGSNAGQNGTLPSLPLTGGFVPGAPGGGFVASQLNAHPSRNNGIWEFSVQQSRLDVETRTPTSWGEARTFFAFDWAGCDNFSCQDLQQGGGDSIHPRLRFAYGTLGGFLAGQALSNFSDADADTESMDFGGAIGSTGGQRIPQVRYTVPGPYGSAFSVSAENPWTAVITPGGLQSSDFAVSGTGTSTTPADGVIGPICNGIPCTGAGTAQANPTTTKAPTVTFASYWAQPWGHVDLAGLVRFQTFHDGGYINQTFSAFGGHIAGDVHPHWWGYNKDDFLWSFVVGNAIGEYASGGLNTFYPVATNFTITTACATPRPGCTGGMAASNVLFNPVFAFSTNGGYQHWWAPNLRSTIAAGYAQQDVNAQLIGPSQAIGTNKILWNAFVNLVWNPVAFVTTGVEYMYGHRTVVANLTGHEHVLVYKFRVAF
ncbi:MAG: DcaP family trimeric outer membrane transporter [Stellaceae bacterium]